MTDLTIVVLLAVGLSGLLLWLLIPRNRSSKTTTTQIPSTVSEAIAAAKHYGYFSQIRQAFPSKTPNILRKLRPGTLPNRRFANGGRLPCGFWKDCTKIFQILQDWVASVPRFLLKSAGSRKQRDSF